MSVTGYLDDIGKPAWIGLMIISFVLFWPLGLVVLGYTIGSGRMACWTHDGGGRWQRRMDRMQAAARQWGCGPRRSWRAETGNRAFDEYRAETLRRLEDEQREFMEFLDRLRHAKDKSEFDQFMAERGRRGNGSSVQPQEV
jgi:Protein of unknown function (DUF2852)